MTDTELVERVERLERDNRRLKRVALGVLVLAAACVGLGAAYAKPAVPQKIVAHELNIVDRTGALRAKITASHNEPAMELYDAQGRARAALSVLPSGRPVFTLYDAARSPQVEIYDLPSTGPGITLGVHRVSRARGGGLMPGVEILDSPSRGPFVALDGARPNAFVGLDVAPSGLPSITLEDSQGYVMELGNAATFTPATGEVHRTSADSIVMLANGKKHRVIWQAPQQ